MNKQETDVDGELKPGQEKLFAHTPFEKEDKDKLEHIHMKIHITWVSNRYLEKYVPPNPIAAKFKKFLLCPKKS